MSRQPIPIEKKEFTYVLEAKGFTIDVTNIVLNESANLLISFFDKIGNLIKTDCCIITQPDYDLWTSDLWLVTYVSNKYGLTLSM